MDWNFRSRLFYFRRFIEFWFWGERKSFWFEVNQFFDYQNWKLFFFSKNIHNTNISKLYALAEGRFCFIFPLCSIDHKFQTSPEEGPRGIFKHRQKFLRFQVMKKRMRINRRRRTGSHLLLFLKTSSLLSINYRKFPFKIGWTGRLK